MKKIKHYIAILALIFTVVTPVTVFADTPAKGPTACVNKPILTFPSWYKGLQCDENGKPTLTSLNDIWKIALNLVESLIGAAAYVAAGFIVWGGFKYIKSQGDPGKITEAKSAITQAVIGLGIALASTAIVLFVGSIF